MIGVYDYTVILTYLSLLSAGIGIASSLSGGGHPYIGIGFLLFCGLCDAFDGKVASTKKNRTDTERKFGIQIDSLSDLVAFGVLPAAIGLAFVQTSEFFNVTLNIVSGTAWYLVALKWGVYAILLFYMLAALIRLAYFNVSEEERQSVESGTRKFYLGLPVTSASIVLPFIAVVEHTVPVDTTWLFVGFLLLMAVLFITPFKLEKVGLKGILVMVGIGLLEGVALLISQLVK